MNLNKEKQWGKLTISNDFIFSKLMRGKEICKKVMEILLNFKYRKYRKTKKYKY